MKLLMPGEKMVEGGDVVLSLENNSGEPALFVRRGNGEKKVVFSLCDKKFSRDGLKGFEDVFSLNSSNWVQWFSEGE